MNVLLVLNVHRVIQNKGIFVWPKSIFIVRILRHRRSGFRIELSYWCFCGVFVSLLIGPLIMQKLILNPRSLVQKESFVLMIRQILFDTSTFVFRFHLWNLVKTDNFSSSPTLRFYPLMICWSIKLNLLRVFSLKTWIHHLMFLLLIHFYIKLETCRLVLRLNVYSSVSCRLLGSELGLLLKSVRRVLYCVSF